MPNKQIKQVSAHFTKLVLPYETLFFFFMSRTENKWGSILYIRLNLFYFSFKTIRSVLGVFKSEEYV